MITYKQLYDKGVALLTENNISDAPFDTMQLLLKSCNFSYDEYLRNMTSQVDEKTEEEYLSDILRRVGGEPLQYILGSWSFYESEFYVGEGVLIPRPETEELGEKCIDTVKKRKCKVVYDLCAGSGCIGISIARACPSCMCYLFEKYDEALKYTEKNVEKYALENVKIIKCDIVEDICFDIPKADLIVSNPPYICSDEIKSLQTEVQREPRTALDGGHDGYFFYNIIARKWLRHLNFGGNVAFECGEGQSEYIKELFSPFFDIEIAEDVFGCKRFVVGYDYKHGGC